MITNTSTDGAISVRCCATSFTVEFNSCWVQFWDTCVEHRYMRVILYVGRCLCFSSARIYLGRFQVLIEVQNFCCGSVFDVFEGIFVNVQDGEFDKGGASIGEGEVGAKENVVGAAFFNQVAEIFYGLSICVQSVVNFGKGEIDIPI